MNKKVKMFSVPMAIRTEVIMAWYMNQIKYKHIRKDEFKVTEMAEANHAYVNSLLIKKYAVEGLKEITS